MCSCLWRGSPGPPLPPLGAGSQQLCLPCSGVSGMSSCLWRGSSGPPSPVGGRQSLPCSASHVSVVCFLICITSGLRLVSSLTHRGEATPPPFFHSKFILSAGLLPPFTLSPLGPVPLRHLVPTLLGGVSLHCSIGSFLNHLSTHGGVGARGMPSRTPPTPPLPAPRGGGGVCFQNMSSTTRGPKTIYILTAHLESPSQVHVTSVQFIMWRGSTDPPLPPLGAVSQ